VFGLVGEWGPAEGAWAGSGAMEASRHEAVIFPTTQKILCGNFGCNSLVPVFLAVKLSNDRWFTASFLQPRLSPW
jgi:hypothetical protein